jgi:F-box protein 9
MSRSATSVAKTATTATNSVIDDNVNDSTVQQVEESSHNTTNHALSPEQQRDPQKGEPEQQQQLWFREWELTWPIWHMLSRDDRRSLAHQHGYKTIGEFEEFMTLQRAVGDSTTTTSTVTEPYDNDLAYPSHYLNHQQVAAISNVANVKQKKTAGTNLKKTNHDDDDEEEDEEEYDHKQTPVLVRASSMASTTPSNTTASTAELSSEELLERAGQILMLPDELLHAIFRYLPVDAYGTLALVSPYWKHVTRTEAVYKRLCERLYLHQSQRKTLQVSRFGNSYRTMLEQRARVRAGGGVYVLKYCEVKKIQRDMWTEVRANCVWKSQRGANSAIV